MKRYIKINENNEITDLFNWFSRYQFDGTEIEFDDTIPFIYTINGETIKNEFGVLKFTWDGSSALLKSQSSIDNDPEFIIEYKKLKKEELQAYIGMHTLDILNNHTWTEIVTQWNNFKQNASGWTTKSQVDNAFNQAINWLNT